MINPRWSAVRSECYRNCRWHMRCAREWKDRGWGINPENQKRMYKNVTEALLEHLESAQWWRAKAKWWEKQP